MFFPLSRLKNQLFWKSSCDFYTKVALTYILCLVCWYLLTWYLSISSQWKRVFGWGRSPLPGCFLALVHAPVPRGHRMPRARLWTPLSLTQLTGSWEPNSVTAGPRIYPRSRLSPPGLWVVSALSPLLFCLWQLWPTVCVSKQGPASAPCWPQGQRLC